MLFLWTTTYAHKSLNGNVGKPWRAKYPSKSSLFYWSITVCNPLRLNTHPKTPLLTVPLLLESLEDQSKCPPSYRSLTLCKTNQKAPLVTNLLLCAFLHSRFSLTSCPFFWASLKKQNTSSPVWGALKEAPLPKGPLLFVSLKTDKTAPLLKGPLMCASEMANYPSKIYCVRKIPIKKLPSSRSLLSRCAPHKRGKC